MLTYRLNSTLTEGITNSRLAHAIFPNVYILLNTLSLFIFLPIINHFFIPCMPSVTIRQRIGIGMVIAILSLGLGAFLEWIVSDLSPLHKALWFTIPTVLLTLPEVFVFVSGKV